MSENYDPAKVASCLQSAMENPMDVGNSSTDLVQVNSYCNVLVKRYCKEVSEAPHPIHLGQ